MMKIFLFTLMMFFTSNGDFTVTYTEDDLVWLAKNIYYEARDQSFAGRLAVAHVTINRVYDTRYPNTIKQVVTQGPTYTNWKGNTWPLRHMCQFSWYCDGRSDEPYDVEIYNDILLFVMTFLQEYDIMPDITEGATHYHADYVTPEWALTKTRTTEIEDHIFYRWEL